MKKIIHNVETNDIELVDLTDSDLELREKDVIESEGIKSEIAAKQAQKAMILEKLGLTQEEANLLLS